MKIDLSLKNKELYAGCEVEVVAGRDNLTTPVTQAVELVGANIAALLDALQHTREEAYGPAAILETWNEVTLTGPMAVWSYLVVFHAVVHRFRMVYYDDGRSGPVLIAAHG